MSRIAARLQELGLTLPPVFPPAGNYLGCTRSGNLLYVGGHGPVNGAVMIRGKVGGDLTLEQGREAARMTALSILATMNAELGGLDSVRRIVKVLGMVNSDPSFTQHPKVINGFSDLMVQVFGDRGKHARSAVGMGSLPFNIPVEIDVVVEVADD